MFSERIEKVTRQVAASSDQGHRRPGRRRRSLMSSRTVPTSSTSAPASRQRRGPLREQPTSRCWCSIATSTSSTATGRSLPTARPAGTRQSPRHPRPQRLHRWPNGGGYDSIVKIIEKSRVRQLVVGTWTASQWCRRLVHPASDGGSQAPQGDSAHRASLNSGGACPYGQAPDLCH